MQVFFALSCLLAIVALSSGASEQSRAGDEAQAAVVPTLEVRQDPETAAQVQVKDSTATSEVTDGATREKRHHHYFHHQLRKSCRFGCYGAGGCGSGCAPSGNPCLQPSGCGQVVSPCLQQGCGQIASTNVVVVPRPVPVAQPVAVPVEVVKVVRHPVLVPQPVPVPVTKVVPVPVPVQPVQPCSGQVILPCSGQAVLPCGGSPCEGSPCGGSPCSESVLPCGVSPCSG